MTSFVPFDAIRSRLCTVLSDNPLHSDLDRLYLVRDLLGKVRISIPDVLEDNKACYTSLRALAEALSSSLGCHAYPPEDSILFSNSQLLSTLDRSSVKLAHNTFFVDRMITGAGWSSINDQTASRSPSVTRPKRITLYSVKGGVGRSTTATVLSRHLAEKGERVLVLDLDLESPGLSSAMLEPIRRPKFGVVDWFVEDLVAQSSQVVQDMVAAPYWAQNLEGDVYLAPAHGRDPGEYLEKLGRVYMDSLDEPWVKRLERFVENLEDALSPTFVIIESRNGLHDIAAATVTDLDAEVFLFATDSDSVWTDYGMLFDHWKRCGAAEKIRTRLSIISALTPEIDARAYLERFRERSWDLFQEQLYDQLPPTGETGEEVSFALTDDLAPHSPVPIHWTRGLSVGSSLHEVEDAILAGSYRQFLQWFDELSGTWS